MRRITLLSAFVFLLIPASVEAQPRLMIGGGLSNPTGDFSDVAGSGFHGRAGLQIGVPAFPLAVRADGEYHSFGEEDPALGKYSILDGTLSAVLSLGGIGLSPYVLAGIGAYRVSTDILDGSSQTGYHGGFGVSLGALGFGGWVELRYVKIEDLKYIPISVGIRL